MSKVLTPAKKKLAVKNLKNLQLRKITQKWVKSPQNISTLDGNFKIWKYS